MALVDVQGKTVSELMTEVSHLYRALMHTTPSFVLREDYKGTPDSPSPIKGRHDYVAELGFWQPGEKGGKTFHVLKSATSHGGFDKALQALIESLNEKW
jgi:hypothetical protein